MFFTKKCPRYEAMGKLSILILPFYFFLEKKVTKIQGFITMLAVLSQRYLLAIQGMKEHYKSRHFTLLCIATHMPFTHTSV
jgi:hypothetical protein